jgi:hypothetical protein
MSTEKEPKSNETSAVSLVDTHPAGNNAEFEKSDAALFRMKVLVLMAG